MTIETVYVIDDDASVRTSLGRLLKMEGFDVASFGSAIEFLKQNRYRRPACIVSDIRMPGIDGLDLQQICVEKGIRIPIVFITGHGEVPMSVQAMKKGAVDFLPKPYSPESLLAAVRQAFKNESASLDQEHSAHRVRQRLESLSLREKEVLDGVIAGRLNKQIAFKMGISEKTVKVHRAAVMQKMKVGSVAHLVRLIDTPGLISTVK